MLYEVITMPANLPCNFCHLYFPNNGYQQSGGKTIIYGLTWTPAAGGGTLGTNPSTSHTISKATAPPISNYQACFACHGASSYNGAPQTTPFHGHGPMYNGEDNNGGDSVITSYSIHYTKLYDAPGFPAFRQYEPR